MANFRDSKYRVISADLPAGLFTFVSYQRYVMMHAFFSLAVLTSLALHPVHVTISEVEYNRQAHTLEMSVKVFVDDLAQALTERTGREVYFGDDVAATEHDSLIMVYVHENLRIFTDSAEVHYRLIGKEGKDNDMWLYLEAPVGQPFQKIAFRNTLLMDLFSDQKNFIHFRMGEFRMSVACVKAEAEKVIEVD